MKLVILFIQNRFFLSVVYLRQLIQTDLESRFIVRSQLGPSIQSGSSPSAGLQVVTQSTHLSKNCYPQLASNPHRSEIRSPKQLDYKCMPLHPDYRCMSLHPAKNIMIKKHMESYIYATYQRTFLKQLLKKTFKPTKENPSTVEKLLIKLLTLFFYCFNQMEKLTTSVKIFLHT